MRGYLLKKWNSIPFDQIAGYLFLLTILTYVCAYGSIRLSGFHITEFSLVYLTIILPIWLIDGLKTSFESLLPREYKVSEQDLSKVAVIIACKDGEKVIGPTLDDILRRFRREHVIVVSNGSLDKTCEVVREKGAVCVEVKEPIGKVRAINYGLSYTNKPYVLILDDDTHIGKANIPTGLLDEGYEGVAFRVLVHVSTWVTKFQMYEYRKSTDVGKRYHNKKASVQNISGAIGLFKRSELVRQIKKHTGEFSGEDLQRTLLIHLTEKAKGVVLSNSIVMTDPPSTVTALFKQRVYGWFPGLYANFVNYFKILTRDRMPFALRMDAFYNCFLVMLMDIVRLLSLPILIFYPWYFVVMYLVYLILEIVSYIRSGLHEPLWVVLLYPFYGLFVFITRVCAFVTFLYRRTVTKIAKYPYLDDYRRADRLTKSISVIFVTLITFEILILNVSINYSHFVTNFKP